MSLPKKSISSVQRSTYNPGVVNRNKQYACKVRKSKYRHTEMRSINRNTANEDFAIECPGSLEVNNISRSFHPLNQDYDKLTNMFNDLKCYYA